MSTEKVWLITGASRGIGKAIAIKLGALGASVAVNYVSDEAAAESVVAVIKKARGRAIAIRADMRQSDGGRSLFERTITEFGGVDILVNNAGVRLFKPIVDITEAEFDNIFAVNVKGVFLACQMASQKLADGGRIINISSSLNGFRTKTRHRDNRGAITSKLGFSVVAPMSTTTPDSTLGSSASCCALLNRWISSMNRMAWLTDCLALLITSRTSFTPELMALSV